MQVCPYWGGLNAKPMTKAEQAIRQWAIEQAVKWPQVATNADGLNSGMNYSGPAYTDADVLGRAEKLLRFVSGVKE
jgi:hypothetical protein